MIEEEEKHAAKTIIAHLSASASIVNKQKK